MLPSRYAKLPDSEENAIINGLNVRAEDRTQSVAALREELNADQVKRHWVKTKRGDVGKTPLWFKLAGAAGILAGAVLLVLASIWVWTEVIHPSYNRTLIPNLCGIEIVQARSKADSDGFGVTIGNKEYDDVQPKGYVLAQDQRAGNLGEQVKSIIVMISAGRESFYMPDVCGLSLEEAKAQLEAVGIIVSVVEIEAWTAPGYVDAQSITEGTELHKGEEVVLSVSKGQTGLDSSKEAEIPELAGHPYQEAKELAGTSGFYIYQAERVYDDNIPKGQVIAQTPQAAERASLGTAIAVTVSMGREMVRMPDVQYEELEAARARLEELGFLVETEDVDRGTELLAGHIAGQSIEAGAECPKGTRVVLQVNRPANQGNVITEPSTYVSLAPTETQESTGTTLPSQTTQSSSQAQGSKTWYRYRMRNEDDPTTIKQEGREEYRSAETQTTYGLWSGWSDTPPSGNTSGLDIASQIVEEQKAVTRYHYFYYTYTDSVTGLLCYTYSASPGNAVAGSLAGPYRKTAETRLSVTGYQDGYAYCEGGGVRWFEGDYRGDSCAKTENVTTQKEQWHWRPMYEITTYYYYTDWGPWHGWYEYDGLVEPDARTQVEMKVE